MEFSFDAESIRFFLVSFVLIGIVFTAGRYVAGELGAVAYENGTMNYIPLASVRAAKPAYKRIAEDAAIISSQETVLARRDALIQKNADFIFADLTRMQLSLYRGGTEKEKFPISARGKKDTFFETPTGVYAVSTKEENHLSSIGKVWMPWSMHFYGNYFVHGWPYYLDGTPVLSSFSGGCIRLQTEDAKKLYRMVSSGMPLLVYSDNSTLADDSESFYFKKIIKDEGQSASAFSALSLLAADFETGQILYEKNTREPQALASLTKLMTALVAVENINRFKALTITKNAIAAPGSKSGMSAGETLQAQDFLYPLLLASANDVAQLFEGSAWNFSAAMNEKARALGLAGAHFSDASGIDPANKASAEDVFKILQFIYTHKQPIFSILKLKTYTITTKQGNLYRWENHAWAANDPEFMGGKSGNSPAAGETFAGVFHIKVSEFKERPIAIIVLNSQNRMEDIEKLRRYIRDNFFYGTASIIREQRERPLIVQEGALLFEAITGFISP